MAEGLHNSGEIDVCLSDADLAAGLKAKDPAAYEELVHQYRPKFLGKVLGICKNLQDAEDIVQEIFLKIVEHIDDFKGNSALGTWLFMIALNTAREFLRKKKRRRIDDHEPVDDEKAEGGFWPRSPQHASPETILLARERFSRTLEACAQLPPRYQDALVACMKKEPEHGEGFLVAAGLGLPLSTFKIHLHRARQALHKKLQEQDAFEDARMESRQGKAA